MRSRMLSSFPFLLAGILAVSAVDPPRIECNELDSTKDLLEQMRVCKGLYLKYKNGDAFVLSGLDQATADDVFFMKKKINRTEVPDTEKPKHIKCSITIRDSTVERLTLFIEATASQQAVKIMNNPILNTVILRTDANDLPKIDLTVKGNTELWLSSIKKLPKTPGVVSSIIQEHKECFFDSKPLGSLADLEGCAGVEGDLVINSGTDTANISSSLQIKKIRNGCLRIENSKLTNLEFLKDLLKGSPPSACSDSSQNPFIKGNTQLCLTSEEQILWKKYQLTYAGTCKDRCSVKFAKANQNAPCTIVTGDVKIIHPVAPADLKHWDRVTVLAGTLEVDGTDLTDITIFKSLTKIVNPSRAKRALTVTRNSKMANFDLPKLDKIEQPSDTWQAPMLFHQNNDKFKLSWKDYKRWQKITRQSNLVIPNVGPPMSPTTASPPMTATRSQEDIRKQNIINEKANRETERNGYWFVAGIYTGTVLLGIGIPLGIVIYFSCKDRCCAKKMKREDHDHVVIKKQRVKRASVVQETASKQQPQKVEQQNSAEREELTGNSFAGDFSLWQTEADILNMLDQSYKERRFAKAAQMEVQAVEMPFKMSDMIKPELNFNVASQSKLEEKTSPKCFRFIENYRLLFYNPTHLNRQKTLRMEKFDPHAVLTALLTNFKEFYVTNAHLMPDTIKYLSGPYYGGKSKNLLAKIDGSVTCVTDIHSMLDTLQVILSLDFDETPDLLKRENKVHPAFRQKYVFLGDYVDRGRFGMECSVLVCLLARLFPGNFVVLRGNHDYDVDHLDGKNRYRQTINTWGDALKKRGELANPYHFADSVYWDYVQDVVAYMPYACLINGRVFACHGGMSMTMLRKKGTLDEMFEKVPVKFIEDLHIKQRGCARYYGYKEDARLTRQMKEKAVAISLAYFGLNRKTPPHLDEYTKRMDDMWRGFDLALDESGKIQIKFEHPWLFELMWSDPGTVLAAYGNPRGAGNTYSEEHVNEFCEKFGLDYIVRGHQMRFCMSPDSKVVSIYSNPYHLLNETNMDNSHDIDPQPVEMGSFGSILRINADGTRTFVFITLDWEKERDQALLKMNMKIQREYGRKRKDMVKIRKKAYDYFMLSIKMAEKKANQKKRKKMIKSSTSLQSISEKKSKSKPSQETSKSTQEKKPDKSNTRLQSTPKKKLETGKGTEKNGTKSGGEKSQVKSTASGEEGKTPKTPGPQ